MDLTSGQNPDMSVASPGEDSDAVLSPVAEPEQLEPSPGMDGVPFAQNSKADRTEPYTRIVPFQEKHDTSVEFFYKPFTLSVLACGLILLAYVATTQDVLEEGRDKRRVPHPAFWRIILGINLLYELGLVFLLFQDLGTARVMMTYIDPKLGTPLPEKSYAEDCAFTTKNIWNALDIFCIAHTLGWFGKAMILRDYWFCWILSIAFELAEYSLQHQLANFAECWWDHWILDVLVCNWIGTYLGMKVCQYLEVKPYEWRGLRQTRGLRSKAKRVLSQFSPHDFTAFKWGTASSFTNYVVVVLLLAVFLAAELNPFYLKALLWMEPDHPIVILRLAGVFLFGTPKYLANKMKSKGLQRLRWYCQVCEKQCRDENGFKCHMTSESHLRQMLVVGENAGRHISDFSMRFQSEFVSLLSRRFGTKRVQANRVYQEYISDKSHLHMNATRWVTLTEFCKHLGRSGIARVDETEKGWFIAWIDNSPKALAKQVRQLVTFPLAALIYNLQEASMKKDRATMSDEQRERLLIAEQIERATIEAEASPDTKDTVAVEEGLKREDGAEKVVLSLSLSKPAAPTFLPENSGSSLSLKNPLKVVTNPLKSNPLKRPNVFKSASSNDVTDKSNDKKRPAPMSAAEKLIIEEQERKRRRMERETI
ncbi:hypothetical protein C0993_002293 [Termitomyces sp. T159_Od127]|nr:hypothetical protein C0993_002293 [Termitomyces sp. T159_Od127]